MVEAAAVAFSMPGMRPGSRPGAGGDQTLGLLEGFRGEALFELADVVLCRRVHMLAELSFVAGIPSWPRRGLFG